MFKFVVVSKLIVHWWVLLVFVLQSAPERFVRSRGWVSTGQRLSCPGMTLQWESLMGVVWFENFMIMSKSSNWFKVQCKLFYFRHSGWQHCRWKDFMHQTHNVVQPRAGHQWPGCHWPSFSSLPWLASYSAQLLFPLGMCCPPYSVSLYPAYERDGPVSPSD